VRQFASHREAHEWYTKAERNLLVSYVGVNAEPLRQILELIRESHKAFWLEQLEESARASHPRAAVMSESDDTDTKQNVAHTQEDFFMATERNEAEKINAQFVKITRIGQTVAGTIKQFGKNSVSEFFVLSPAYAREQVGGEWMKFESMAVGLSAGLVRKINADRDKGINILCHYRDDEQTEHGVKKVFKVMQLDTAELAEIEGKATDRRAERAEQEQKGGKMLPIFAEQSRSGSDDTENLI
jgi:hypothetical protein